MFVVEIFWNTEADGMWVEDDLDYPRSLYGPFESQDEAELWMEDRLDDGDVHDMIARELNADDDLDYINYPSEY